MMGIKEKIEKKHFGDDEQLDFIFSEEKMIVVTAPAGCGKTTAMVSKIAWELSKGSIPTNKKVLALTFSVNAAMKIKDSLKKLMPDVIKNCDKDIEKVDIANYHNFAMKLIYKHGYVLHDEFIYLSDFQIVNESSSLLNKYLISSDIDKFKEFANAVNTSNSKAIKKLKKDYWSIIRNKLLEKHIITYSGLLVAAIEILSIESIANFYKNYYKMLIIDEFQDTNYLGFWLVNKLIGDNIVIFLGDDFQKIYGFMGAINGILDKYSQKYIVKEIEFLNNYRFSKNEKMKKLDKFIRSYGDNYEPSKLTAEVNSKVLENDAKENDFIIQGIKKILSTSKDKVSVLVRVGYHGDSIVNNMDKNGIPYFNVLFKETDTEYIKFYDVAIEEFHRATGGTGKAVQKDLKTCLNSLESRKKEIYFQPSRKFVFDAMFRLLQVLFEESKKWDGTTKDRYDNIDFILNSNGLKHMMEFIEEPVVLTTVHAAKGLEWDYVIIPKMNSFAFPNGHVCGPCKDNYSCNEGNTYCEFKFDESMKNNFREEISVLYVALTRAKKDVFITVNTGLNQRNYHKRTSCFLNLDGLKLNDYEWNDVI